MRTLNLYSSLHNTLMQQCYLHQHEIILILIILSIGALAGYVNFLKAVTKEAELKTECLRYTLSGIGAATLVPLFLNMLSSNLIKMTANFDNINYFVFTGFCFIAGYFSDRFIDTIGDKVLKELQQTKDKVNSTSDKLERTSQALQESEDKIDVLVDNETEVDEDDVNINIEGLSQLSQKTDDDLSDQTFKIVNSFTNKYKFRTIKGIAKELKYSHTIVEFILDGLEKQGVVKKLTNSHGEILWALTRVGQTIKTEEKTDSI